MSMLFSSIKINDMELKNRIVMPHMCMYHTNNESRLTDWHFVHYVTRAVGGVGLIIQEATAVEPIGRISDNDLGLWSKTQADPLRGWWMNAKDRAQRLGYSSIMGAVNTNPSPELLWLPAP